MIPFPRQSHLNQLLHLSCLISSHDIHVLYATSAKPNSGSTTRTTSKIPESISMKSPLLISSLLPPIRTPPPPTFLPISSHPLKPLCISVSLWRSSFTARRVIVVHDILMTYAVQDIANVPNAESYALNPTSTFSSFFNGWQIRGKPFLEEPPPEGLPFVEGCFSFEILKFIHLQADFVKFKAGNIYNSCRSIEGTYIDLHAKNQFNKNKLEWAVGPLSLGKVFDRAHSNRQQHKCLEWLDKQAPKSVLYVSFGTTTSMTDEEIKELTLGLEQSLQKFFLVLRDADKGDIFAGDVKREKLPEGYKERVKEVGMVVRDWAPQVEILGHPSTGGFMSHCGWNSCLESITMGVPIAAWPMHSD